MAAAVPLPGPDASQRMDPADFKGHLDVPGYWNLDTVERTFALFRNVVGPGNVIIEHRRCHIEHQAAADDYYARFKRSLVVNLNMDDSFCGGAFREKVKMTSPVADILNFVLCSPVITYEQKRFMKLHVAKHFYQVVSTLREREEKIMEACGEEYFEDEQDKLIDMDLGFAHFRTRQMPIPDDISDAWLEEFGPVFTANYKKALSGDPTAPFKVMRGIRNKFGLAFEGYGRIKAEVTQDDDDYESDSEDGYEYNNFMSTTTVKNAQNQRAVRSRKKHQSRAITVRGTVQRGHRDSFSSGKDRGEVIWAVSGNVPLLRAEPSVESFKKVCVSPQYPDRFAKLGGHGNPDYDLENEEGEHIGLEDMLEHRHLQVV